MILTVSTVKDSVDNLAAFVRRNLAGGADHLLVFLDAPGDDPAVEAFLGAHDHVTVVRTDSTYWGGARPDSLNDRQLVNANLANAALAALGWADWLFHIDADESLQIDADKLARLGREITLVRIAPLEAVSQLNWTGEVTHFKPLLSRERIDDLVARGLIEAPGEKEAPNATWFSGHVMGKLGVRPDVDVRLDLHKAFRRADGTPIKAYADDWLLHRHYESHSGEEFVRKWMAHLAAGSIRLRPRRQRLMRRIRAIADDASLSQVQRADALTALYREEIEDDLPALEALGVLVVPPTGAHRPSELTAQQHAELAQRLAALVPADKAAFDPRTEASPRDLLTRLGLPVESAPRGLLGRLRRRR